MKRFLLIAFLMLPVSKLAAQGTSWLIEAGITMGFMDRMSIMGFGRLYDQTMYGGLYKTAEITLTNYYEEEGAKSKAVFLPALTFKALRRIPKVPWLSAGVAALWNYAYKDYFGGPAPLHESEHILHALPCCRFYYLQSGEVRLYAEIAAGARIRRYYETFNGDVQSNGDVSFTFQTVLIGVDVGDRWFMSTSLGYGTAWSPFLLGTGFKF